MSFYDNELNKKYESMLHTCKICGNKPDVYLLTNGHVMLQCFSLGTNSGHNIAIRGCNIEEAVEKWNKVF